jgi:hypothetical protein
VDECNNIRERERENEKKQASEAEETNGGKK